MHVHVIYKKFICYPTNNLMAYEGDLPFPSIDKNSDFPIVSLREAAKIQKEIKCNCRKGCKSNQCTCRSSGFKCSTHCHPTSSTCCNRQLEDNIKENGMKRTRNVDENDVKEEYVKRAKVLLLL